jgi:hypothetical protein
MSDAKLWINDADSTATIAGTNVSYTMPLWVFDVMRDIIGAEAEKKVEVTHSDFDTQQELLDRYRADNAKLRELCADLYAEMITYSNAPNYNASVWAPKLRELGVEVDG